MACLLTLSGIFDPKEFSTSLKMLRASAVIFDSKDFSTSLKMLRANAVIFDSKDFHIFGDAKSKCSNRQTRREDEENDQNVT